MIQRSDRRYGPDACNQLTEAHQLNNPLGGILHGGEVPLNIRTTRYFTFH